MRPTSTASESKESGTTRRTAVFEGVPAVGRHVLTTGGFGRAIRRSSGVGRRWFGPPVAPANPLAPPYSRNSFYGASVPGGSTVLVRPVVLLIRILEPSRPARDRRGGALPPLGRQRGDNSHRSSERRRFIRRSDDRTGVLRNNKRHPGTATHRQVIPRGSRRR